MRKINFRWFRNIEECSCLKIHYTEFPLDSTFHLETGTADFVFVERALCFEGAFLKVTQLLQELALLFFLWIKKS